MEWFVRVGQGSAVALRTLWCLPGTLVRPSLWGGHLYRALVGALPIALVGGAALGLVAWMQLHSLLAQIQAVEMLPKALALAVVWEFGPVAAGLIAAGRLGAGLGAELGAMRISEQLDAAATLGVPIIQRVIAPRVLACVLALPVVTIFVDYVAILASFAAEATGGTMNWDEYRRACLEFLKLKDAIPATLKTLAFGFVVGLFGCLCGIGAEGGTEGVGRAATWAVVSATLAVLIADVVLVRMTQLLAP